MMKVLKFGGTSMGNADNMRMAAEILFNEKASVTVLSAMSGTTNALAEIVAIASCGGSQEPIITIVAGLDIKYRECARLLLKEGASQVHENIKETFELILSETAAYKGVLSERVILAQGELLTSVIFTAYLRQCGMNAVLLHAPDYICKNADAHADVSALKGLIDDSTPGTHFITQGFICRDMLGNIDNLGRGGSDYSAALIGAAVDADQVQIWTDIDGMHNNDPRIVENTFPIHTLHYDEAAELAYFGAKILHPLTVQPCKEKGIPVRLGNTMQPDAQGTMISNREDEGHHYKAVAAKDNITLVRINSARMLMAYGFLRKVFEVFEKYETPIDMITTSEVSVSLTIDNNDRLADLVRELREFGAIEIESGNSIVCVVGKLDSCERGRAFDIMGAVSGFPLKMISYGASHRSLSMLVDTQHKKDVLVCLNDKLFSDYAQH